MHWNCCQIKVTLGQINNSWVWNTTGTGVSLWNKHITADCAAPSVVSLPDGFAKMFTRYNCTSEVSLAAMSYYSSGRDVFHSVEQAVTSSQCFNLHHNNSQTLISVCWSRQQDESSSVLQQVEGGAEEEHWWERGGGGGQEEEEVEELFYGDSKVQCVITALAPLTWW